MAVRTDNPLRKRWLVAAGIGAAALLVGGYAYARAAAPKPEKPPSKQKAVRKAVSLLGRNANSNELTDVAYTMAYPKCPPKLDPGNPQHEDCIAKWLELQDMVIAETAKPRKAKDGTPIPEPTNGPAADMQKWLDSLTSSQRSGLRKIIGGQYYDPIKNAAGAGDDAGTVEAVLRFKRAVEEYAYDDPIGAYKQYSELQNLLGPKLDTLLRAAKKYQ